MHGGFNVIDAPNSKYFLRPNTMSRSLRAYRIAYDGRPYHGFQRQPDVPTVEDTLFDALRALEVLDTAKPAGYAASGRTDAGVSAVAQTVALEAPEWLEPRAWNAELPPSVRAWAVADVPEGFHATHHARERTYTYHLYAPEGSATPALESLGVDSGPFADDRFHGALEALSGRHDFHNLTPDSTGTEREVTLEARRSGPVLEITVTAGGFARELVRRLVSLAVEVGCGAPLERIERALDPEPLPGHAGVAPAPPEPLVLTAVSYPALSFDVDTEAVASARAVFERQRVDQLLGARVAEHVLAGLEKGF